MDKNDYQKIAVIIIRGLAVSFLVSAAVEIGIIASDFLFVQTAIFTRSEVAFKVRVIEAAFYFLASMFLYYQSRTIGKALIQGLFDESPETEKNVDEPTPQD